MIKTLRPVIAFIKDYGLEKPNENICFTALIYFSSENINYNFTSEVYIISFPMHETETIYLLNPEVTEKGIPTMFTDSGIYSYTPGRSLIIKGFSEQSGRYIISIHPSNSNCEPETLEELESKKHN